ncbi:hypothetical protein AAVH_22789 [Aphelenchoides avenae]|nr:hypothetical protein AAVH_22789 [Aphelenchus avenae]
MGHGGYEWVDGTPFGPMLYENWAPAEPVLADECAEMGFDGRCQFCRAVDNHAFDYNDIRRNRVHDPDYNDGVHIYA